VVVFCKQPATRKHYQAMFAQRRVKKTYEAIAPRHDGLPWPVQRSTWMHEDPAMFLQMVERPGAPGERPNAETLIEPIETQGAWTRYRLRPTTGQRHQLRVHLAALGLPILGDRIYPVLQPENTDDPANPLRLLARHIEFHDPLTGVLRRFESARTLAFPTSPTPPSSP
jgi:tRNA pseudouridine32 synthase / 23S rRNA pseudouridine746 synthase